MKIAKIRDVKTPSRGTSKSAGIDFFVPNDWKKYYLFPGNDVIIPSGILYSIPENTALIGFNKSGIATKSKLVIGACVGDEDYQGELHIHLFNIGKHMIEVCAGDKIAQFIVIPILYEDIEVVDENDIHINNSERGTGKFGSTND